VTEETIKFQSKCKSFVNQQTHINMPVFSYKYPYY